MATLTAGANYNDLTLNATLTITPRVISVTWNELDGNSGVYNGLSQGVELVISNVVDGDDVQVLLKKTFDGVEESVVVTEESTTYSAINASTKGYYLQITGLNGTSKDNYELGENLATSFAIAKRTIEVVGWSDGTKTYVAGEEMAFNYAKVTYVITPFIGELTENKGILASDVQSVVITTLNNSYRDVGDYVATATLEENINYQMSQSSRVWSIVKREVSIVWTTDTQKKQCPPPC